MAGRLVSLDEVLRDEAGADLRAMSAREKAKLVPRRAGALKSREPRVRLLAARALGNIGPEAGDAIPDLLGLLGDTGLESAVGAEAAAAYARIAPAPMPRLMAALKEGDPETRRNVACALGGLGQNAGEAVPLLLELTRDRDPELQRCARLSLEKIPQRQASRHAAGAH